MEDSRGRPITSHNSEYSPTKLVYTIREPFQLQALHPTPQSTTVLPGKGLKMLLWNSYTAFQSKKRQLQAKNQQLHERNEYTLELDEQLKKQKLLQGNLNEQHEHIEVVNVDDKNRSQTTSSSTFSSTSTSTSSKNPRAKTPKV